MLVLYDKNTSDFSNLGFGVLRDLKSDPEITEVLNGLYNLEFKYIIDGWLSEKLIEGNVIKANGQLFRIREVKKNIINKDIQVLAKHIWFDLELNNMLIDVAPTNKLGHTALQWILDHAENQTNFVVTGDCTKYGSARYVRKDPIDAVYNADNALLKKFGGEIELNNYNITLHNRRGLSTGLEIRQKKNVSGATYSVDLSSLATRILPVGNDGITLPEKYVDSQLINNYYAPFYYILNVDVGVDEDNNVTLNDCYNIMRQAAQDFLDTGVDIPKVSISIDFVELAKTEEYRNYSNLETAHLGDSCKVKIPDLNVDVETRIVKTVYNVAKKRITKMELGNLITNYVTSNSKTSNELENAVSKINVPGILREAKEEASDLIKQPFEGYIYISDSSGELYIMDTQDINTAQKVWKFGLGGIGYSSTGINGTYTTAITQDGKIVADFIKAGILSGIEIVATLGNIGGFSITSDSLFAEYYAKHNYTQNNLSKLQQYLAGQTTLTDAEKEYLDANSDGVLDIKDLAIIAKCLAYGMTENNPMRIIMKNGSNGVDSSYEIVDGNNVSRLKLSISGITTDRINAGNIDCGTCTLNSNNNVSVSFNKTFANVPRVVITPNTTSANVIAPKIREVSTTGFKAIIGGSGFSNIDCDWIAIDA